MLPVNYNFSIYRGDATSKEFRFYDFDAATQTKTPIDLTGAVVIAQVRDSTDYGASLIFSFDATVSGETVTLSVDPETTQKIEAGSYVYDLQINDRTYLFGKVKLLGDISYV